jgi:hypothetical protein
VRALTVSEIIQLWETAYRYHPLDQALSMLQPVLPNHSRDELAAMSLGQRDTLLLSLRMSTFGDVLPATSQCPVCAGTIEFELSCSTLHNGVIEPHPEQLSEDGYSITIRPLNSLDLAAATAATDTSQSRAVLLRRCVTEARHGEKLIDLDALPKGLEERIADAALAADSQAEILLDLDCPDCQHRWQNVFDIAHILWLEISARAQRILQEVHVLARAYGWSETEIFELSPQRRAAYLQMATA